MFEILLIPDILRLILHYLTMESIVVKNTLVKIACLKEEFAKSRFAFMQPKSVEIEDNVQTTLKTTDAVKEELIEPSVAFMKEPTEPKLTSVQTASSDPWLIADRETKTIEVLKKC